MFLQLKTNKEVLKCNQELYPVSAGQKIKPGNNQKFFRL